MDHRLSYRCCGGSQVEAKNSLENYAFNMRNTIRDEKVQRPDLGSMRRCCHPFVVLHPSLCRCHLSLRSTRRLNNRLSFCDHLIVVIAIGELASYLLDRACS